MRVERSTALLLRTRNFRLEAEESVDTEVIRENWSHCSSYSHASANFRFIFSSKEIRNGKNMQMISKQKKNNLKLIKSTIKF